MRVLQLNLWARSEPYATREALLRQGENAPHESFGHRRDSSLQEVPPMKRLAVAVLIVGLGACAAPEVGESPPTSARFSSS